MLRFFTALLLLVFVVGCQTGADTEGALKSASISEDEAVVGEVSESDADVTEAVTEETKDVPVEEAETTPVKPVEKKVAPSNMSDPVAAGAEAIAKLRKSKGEKAAVEAVFACYKNARKRSASLTSARVCAAQDFALSRDIISRRKPNATGTGDRALLISKRHGARIGALMQFKGMGQADFNIFGKYLHAVAEPAYKKALSS